MTQDQAAMISRFVSLGLSEQKARETLKNANLTKVLLDILNEAKHDIPEGSGILLFHLASNFKPQLAPNLSLLVQYIVNRKLDTTLRVDKAIKCALNNIKVDVETLEKECGVGVIVTPEEIEQVIEILILENKKELLEKRYRFNSGLLMQKAFAQLPWAEGKAVKSEIDVQVLDLLGPKNEADLAPIVKVAKKQKTSVENKAAKVEAVMSDNNRKGKWYKWV